jgi:hypothetical protein
LCVVEIRLSVVRVVCACTCVFAYTHVHTILSSARVCAPAYVQGKRAAGEMSEDAEGSAEAEEEIGEGGAAKRRRVSSGAAGGGAKQLRNQVGGGDMPFAWLLYGLFN